MKGLLALRRIKHQLSVNFDAFCNVMFGQMPPPGQYFVLFFLFRQPLTNCFSFSAISYASPVETLKPSSQGLIDLKRMFKDSILWAVPKHRRTIEKRLKRKFGCIQDFYKMLMPRTDLFACNHCGHYYQRRHLCRE